MKSLRLILSNLIYFAPAWVFSSINILIGTWILYIPFIKLKFALNDAEVGFALFFTALGLLIAIPFIPRINNKIGLGKSTKIGIIALAVVYNLPLLAPSYILLCGSLFTIGVFSAFTDVSLNALTATIEKREQQNFMSAAHGFFSLGGFVGASVGTFYMSQYSNPQIHILAISTFVIVSNLFLAKNYVTILVDEKKEDKTKGSFFKNIKPLLALSIIAFIILFNEGAVEHWSNLYLFDVVKVTNGKAGLGFVIFSLTMTLGRFLGDGFSKQLGSRKTILFASLVAVFAYASIITTNYYASLFGFGLLGFGLSVIIPEIYRLAGKNEKLETSFAISIVSGIGFVGFLVGPVILGAISNFSNLVMSYVFLAVLTSIAFGLALFGLRKNN
ncbi:MFS transporter [Polaribacter sp. Hel_I_88]|uniref:MFS transporter n=1 Tax=Polaribacter sp. Hel_I_88 TaxID=1250006 RepID=UPI00047E96C7|nr:MFS transporter [Polaribacter sp. Hel_I_88]|tara:strand:- start:596 stop:1756 length:1161 start_codon:yes stop_codon:yes gene_type:complete